MNITVIGASAGVGMATVKRALQRGHTVTTLSRSAINLPDAGGLISIRGNAMDKDVLKKCFEKTDAVIVTLGTGKSKKATTLFSDFAKALVAVQQQAGLQIPFIILTGFGAGESKKYLSLLTKPVFRWVLQDIYADKSVMEEAIASSTMNWIIVRPGLLKNKPLTEKYRVETSLFKGMRIGAINRADVANYMVKQAEHPTDIHLYPALSNK